MENLFHKLLIIIPIISVVINCSPATEPYSGWKYLETANIGIYYMSPPWEICPDQDYPEECHDMEGSISFWIPPLVLLPEFLIIPPYKFEVKEINFSPDTLSLIQNEYNRVSSQGVEIIKEVSPFETAWGVQGHEFIYYDRINREDPRYFRVVIITDTISRRTLKMVLDSNIEVTSEEVTDMLKGVKFINE